MNEVPPDPRSTYCYLISRRSSLSSVVVRPRFTRRCTPTVSKMTAKFWGLPTTIVPFESLETAPGVHHRCRLRRRCRCRRDIPLEIPVLLA